MKERRKMIDLGLFFTEDELRKLFEKWASEAEELAAKKARFDEYMERIKEAKIPFIKKQKELLEKKREKNENADLSAEERIELWYPFHKVCRKITEEIYGDRDKEKE